jgi:hypothetical protein
MIKYIVGLFVGMIIIALVVVAPIFLAALMPIIELGL